MPMMQIPHSLKNTICRSYGTSGAKWLEALPGIVEKACQKWRLKAIPSHFALTYNYVTLVHRENNTKAILKVGFPQESELYTEMDMLEIFDGQGMAKLLEREDAMGAMLLEYITPGHTLRTLQATDDHQATTLASQLLTTLHRPVPAQHNFPHIKDWAKVFESIKKYGHRTITPTHLTQAQVHLRELLESTPEERLLHGDLHHDNILLGPSGPIAIDPKGVIGDPIYNSARFIINFWDTRPTQKRLEHRIESLAKAFRCPPTRVAKWTFVDLSLCHSWTLKGQPDAKIEPSLLTQLEEHLNA